MPVTSITTDPAALTLTAVADFPVPVERLWAAFANPRILERFWGPPTWPATFTRHDMKVGGRSQYHMTGPEGQRSGGLWEFLAVEPGRRFVVSDHWADEAGEPNLNLPSTRMEVVFEATPQGSRFVSTSRFASVEQMEDVLKMGVVEGMSSAMSQIDAVLADLRDFSRSWPTALEVLDDTHIRVVREVRGGLNEVWRAHHEPALVKRWMVGPEGWTMPICEVATEVGQTYRYGWEQEGGGASFGFTGELVRMEAPKLAVTTERMVGVEGPGTVNELRLSPLPGGRTRIEVHITYPSKELRDTVLGSGMVDGMEASYARLEGVIAG